MSKKILNTRAVEQAEALSSLLRAHEVEVVNYPCIAIAAPADTTLLDQSIQQALAGEFDWLIVTSANTVFALAQRLVALGHPADALGMVDDLFVAAVGENTAEEIFNHLSLGVDVIPTEASAVGLAEILVLYPGMESARVWLPQSAIAETTLSQALQDMGATVTAVEAYRTIIGTGGDSIRPQLSSIDALTFTSGSTVRNFLQRLESEGGSREDLAGKVIACIGPSTAKVARELGFEVQVIPAEHTLTGLVDALMEYLP